MIEDRIKHRHLTCFEEVARQKSIGKAAMSLAISQPAVSKTIRELEEILGVELFDRSHRSVELTAYGEVFLRYASASIAALRLGVESVDAAIKSGRPVLKVGAVSSAAALLLPEAVARFLRYGASAVVRVVPGDNAALLSRARMGELDLALVRMSSFGNMVGLTFEHLHHERLVFVARTDHPLAAEPGSVAGHLVDYPVVLPPPDAVTHDAAERLLIKLGLGHVVDRVETISPGFARALLASSDVVWLAPYGEVAGDVASGRLVKLTVETSEALSAVGLARRVDSEPSPSASMLMAILREVAGEVRASTSR